MISSFHHDGDEICVLLGLYAAQSSNPLLTCQDNVSVPTSTAKKSHDFASLDFLTLEDGTDTLSRNISKGSPLDTV
jgi:hypothetical protein